jgi:sulfite exporter TauE/SafE
MILWSAFLLGLVGSLHCAGMCGPLAMAVPVLGRSRGAIIASRLIYNFGRIVTYALLGVVFGLIGQTFALAGFQRWVSLIAGALILIGLFATGKFATGIPMTRMVGRLKYAFGRLLQKRSIRSLFSLGLLNGLLPCGLVYVAATVAMATGSLLGGAGYMAAFGAGTVPMMFGFGLIGMKLQQLLRFRLQKLVPVSLAIVGGLLLLRGMALGIPYVSPGDPATGPACPLCVEQPAEPGRLH